MPNHSSHTDRPMSAPRDTSKDHDLVKLVTAASPDGIMAQERRGQQELVTSDVLPRDTRGSDAAFLALGFTFGEPVDDLFRNATLPAGWRRKGSEHAMWSYLVDARGIRRVAIFYKAAFYDRSAHMDLVNVGNAIAITALYGDGPITRAALTLDLLTAEERASLAASVEHMRAQITESPDIYGKYRARCKQIETLLDA